MLVVLDNIRWRLAECQRWRSERMGLAESPARMYPLCLVRRGGSPFPPHRILERNAGSTLVRKEFSSSDVFGMPRSYPTFFVGFLPAGIAFPGKTSTILETSPARPE